MKTNPSKPLGSGEETQGGTGGAAPETHTEIILKPRHGILVRPVRMVHKSHRFRGKVPSVPRPCRSVHEHLECEEPAVLHTREVTPFHDRSPEPLHPHEEPRERTGVVAGSGESVVRPSSKLIAHLARHPFTRGMDPEWLVTLAQGAREVNFKANEILFREGDVAAWFYLIFKGAIVLESQDVHGQRTDLQLLKAGNVLGWSWLFPPFLWQFQARGVRAGHAIALDGAHILVACEEDKRLGFDLSLRMAQVLIQCLQATRNKLVEKVLGHV